MNFVSFIDIFCYNSSSQYSGDVRTVLIFGGTSCVCNFCYADRCIEKSELFLQLVKFVLYSLNSICFDSQEYEDKILPWLWSFAVFTTLRFLAWLFFSIVNDLIFAYNIFICLFWIVLIVLSVWGWLVVYSLYIELRDLSKLEDLAHLRVSSFLQS